MSTFNTQHSSTINKFSFSSIINFKFQQKQYHVSRCALAQPRLPPNYLQPPPTHFAFLVMIDSGYMKRAMVLEQAQPTTKKRLLSTTATQNS